MVNVGALISTANGLRTVVEVLPGHVDPSLSQAVTLPIGGNGSDALPPEYFGTLLPGQAQSAASFVQTLIFPSDEGAADTSSVPQATSTTQAASTTGTPQPSPAFAQAAVAYQIAQQRGPDAATQRPSAIG